MALTVSDLDDRKTYLDALKATLRPLKKSRFRLVEHRFDGSSFPVLLIGPEVEELIRHLAKSRKLDWGSFAQGAFHATTGKLDAAVLKKLGLADLRLAQPGEKPSQDAAEDDDEPARGADGKPPGEVPKPLAADTEVPGMGCTVAELLADLKASRAKADAVSHAGLRGRILQQITALRDMVARGDLSSAPKACESLRQLEADVAAAPTLRQQLDALKPVAEGRGGTWKDAYDSAEQAYLGGELTNCANGIVRLQTAFAHQPYRADSEQAAQQALRRARESGSLSAAYEAEKRLLLQRIATGLASPAGTPAHDEAQALKRFFEQSATKGMKDTLRTIETTPDGPRRRPLVEKGVLQVQAYINGLLKTGCDGPVYRDYLEMLRVAHRVLSVELAGGG